MSASPSSGLYIPVHKRRSSIARTDDSMSGVEAADAESDSAHETLVYSRDRLLALAKSPLATMPKEVKDGLRVRLPEIVMSRKHRKAIEYRTVMQQRAQCQSKTTSVQAPPASAPARSAARTVELALPLSESQQRHAYSYYHINQRTNTPQQRPVGSAWWSVPKSAPVDGISWRRAAGFASIPVA